MAFAPIALTIPQYENYANNYLKAYDQGTTTPLSLATDATGGTLLVKVQLDAQGFPITAGSARFIPFINGDYDLWLFPTAAEADANDTTNAIQFADNLNAGVPDNNIQFTVANKTAANALTIVDGQKVFITSPDGGPFTMRTGGAIGTYNDDGGVYTGSRFTSGDGSTGIERDEVYDFNVIWYGAVGNTSVVGTPPTIDDTAAINLTITAARSTDKNVILPPGNYLVIDTITIYSGINVVGSIMGGVSNGFAKRVGATEITFNPSTSKDLFVTLQETPTSSHDQFSSISGIRMVGGASGGNANIGININKLIYCAFRNLNISGFKTGIYCKGTINNRFEQIYIDTCSLSCVLIDSTSTTDVFSQCTFFGSQSGVIINDSLSIRFESCLWEQCKDYGLVINNKCENIVSIDGYCEDTPYEDTVADNAMFNVGLDVGTPVISNSLTVIGGSYSGHNTFSYGSFLDTNYTNGVMVSNVKHSRYQTIYTLGGNTKARSVILSGTKGISWVTFTNDTTKLSGHYDPRTIDVSVGETTRSRDARFDGINSDTPGGSIVIGSPVTMFIPSIDWTSTLTAIANCSSPIFSSSKYIKIGSFVYCEVVGTVNVTTISTDTKFKFTLPVSALSTSSAVSGSINFNWGGFGIGQFANNTGANATEQQFIVGSTFVGATGVLSFTFGIMYIPA